MIISFVAEKSVILDCRLKIYLICQEDIVSRFGAVMRRDSTELYFWREATANINVKNYDMRQNQVRMYCKEVGKINNGLFRWPYVLNN